MVTFKDEDWSTASDSQRAEVLAKRGFICQKLVSERDYEPLQTPLRAVMRCELSDGRVFEVVMNPYTPAGGIVKDNRASLSVREIFDGE